MSCAPSSIFIWHECCIIFLVINSHGRCEMVRKETCPVCKGNKVVVVTASTGTDKHRTCPGCNGAGYQVKIAARYN